MFKLYDLSEYIYEQNFPSNFSIDDYITFIPMAVHAEKLKITREERYGRIVAVRFTKAKIFYDIIDDYYGYLFNNVDSALVYLKQKSNDLTEKFKSVYTKDSDSVEILKVKEFDNYVIQSEKLIGGVNGNNPIVMEVAYNKSGDYIGSPDSAKMLNDKYGIAPEKISPDRGICQIGFSKKNKKWYGWSHRAIFGFGIGHKTKLGDANFEPANKQDFINKIKSWYKDDMYQNVKITELAEGVRIQYTINESYNNYTKFIINESNNINNIQKHINESKTDYIEKWPTKWGKGEWTAKSLDDCKQMAISFANSVS